MRYFVLDDTGQQYGPADLATLQQWIAEGRIAPHTRLKDEMSGAISPANQVAGLVFATTQPSAPTMGAPIQMNPPSNTAGNPYADYYRPAGSGGAPVETTTWLVMAIFTTIFCCQPLGIAAIVFAAMAMTSNGKQDYVTAKQQVDRSRICSFISIGLGLAGIIIYCAFAGLAAAAG